MKRIRKFFSDLKSPTTSKSQGSTNSAANDGNIETGHWSVHDDKTIKIILFGSENSGRNTLCKQLKILQLQNAFTDQERVSATTAIRELLRESVQEVAKAMAADGVSFSDDKSQKSLDYCSGELNDSLCWQNEGFYEHIQVLYEEEATTQYIRKLIDSQRVNDNIVYFLDELQSISEEAYVPGDEHLLRCRDKVPCARHLKVPVTPSRTDLFFSILVEQTSTHLSTLLPLTQAVLFAVDLHSFVLKSPHDLLMSLQTFQQVVGHESFPNVHVILLLNKVDRLEETVSTGRLFGSFVEEVDANHPYATLIHSWLTWEGATFDEQRSFVESYPNKEGDAPVVMDAHQRRASFRKKTSMIQGMMARKGISPETVQTAVFIRRLFQDVFASTRLSSAAAGGVDRKSLTVHYTCAVDSITTGRVCEAWRNMLLVDHV